MSKLIKQRIAEDMLKIAHMHNNILYKRNYEKYGIYTKEEINLSFGNFNNACRELHIINPEDPYDLNAVLEDMRYVFKTEKTVSKQTYEDYGIYSTKALQREYGNLNNLIELAVGHKNHSVKNYPIYAIKFTGQNVLLHRKRG